MQLPKWNDPSVRGGTKIRTALWLITEVGLGNAFTKEQHRSVFAGVAQADRRLRDLRSHGWVIHTSKEDLTLNSNEQRLVAIGERVWEKGQRKSAAIVSISAKARMATFDASGYQCSVCGVAAGDKYLDASHSTAVLSVSRRKIERLDGKTEIQLVAECNRCRAGKVHEPAHLAVLRDKLASLSDADQAIFIRWANSGRSRLLDRLWAEYRTLPMLAKEEMLKKIQTK